VSPFEQEKLRARRFGFAALTAWAGAGLGLEGAHAFKLSAYLDQPPMRELLVWGHAHGVGLALVVLAYAALADERASRFGPRLRIAAVLMPLGFVLSIFGHGESDPGPAIWLVPVAGLLLLSALFGITRSLRA
jgi:hypothetical protein